MLLLLLLLLLSLTFNCCNDCNAISARFHFAFDNIQITEKHDDVFILNKFFFGCCCSFYFLLYMMMMMLMISMNWIHLNHTHEKLDWIKSGQKFNNFFHSRSYLLNTFLVNKFQFDMHSHWWLSWSHSIKPSMFVCVCVVRDIYLIDSHH